MHRIGKRGPVYCPHFPKSKDEGWAIVLGCKESQELHAMKRVAIKKEFGNHHIIFNTPDSPGI